MLRQKLNNRRPQTLANLLNRNPRLPTLLDGVPSHSHRFSVPLIHRRIMQDNVLPNIRMPPGKFALQMSIDVPCVNEQQVCLCERAFKITLLMEYSQYSLRRALVAKRVDRRTPVGIHLNKRPIRLSLETICKRIRADRVANPTLCNVCALSCIPTKSGKMFIDIRSSLA